MSNAQRTKLSKLPVDRALGERANTLRVEDAIAGGHKSASWTVIA